LIFGIERKKRELIPVKSRGIYSAMFPRAVAIKKAFTAWVESDGW
jgi:predicted DNA-binding transcriptional regulator AlpA